MLKVRECHKVAVWPQNFNDIISGKKKFDVRKDDRNFKIDDTLMLCEWSPETRTYTGLFSNFKIVDIVDGGLCIEPINGRKKN